MYTIVIICITIVHCTDLCGKEFRIPSFFFFLRSECDRDGEGGRIVVGTRTTHKKTPYFRRGCITIIVLRTFDLS